MYCTQCGTTNDKLSKFCRECGSKLGYDQPELQLFDDATTEKSEESPVANLLYEALKHFENSNLTEAHAKCREALAINPYSTSANSLLALVYERRGDEEVSTSNTIGAAEYYESAIKQMATVLSTNRHSVADQEKLNELQRKLSGLTGRRVKKVYPLSEQIVNTLRRMPPWAIAAGVSLVVFVLVAGVMSGKAARRAASRDIGKFQPVATGGQQAPVMGQPGPAVPQQQMPQQGTTYGTQPPAQQNSLPPNVYSVNPQPSYPAQQRLPVPNLPQNVPVMPDIEAPTIAPARPRPLPTQPKVEQVVVPPAAVPEGRPGDKARTAFASGDYSTAAKYYEQAISAGEDTAENHQQLAMCLENLGNKATAIQHIQRALQLYAERKARGQDPDAAEAGIKSCRAYLAILKD